MVGWHHRFNGHEFEQALGVGEGQGSLACYSPWGHKELDMTEQPNKEILFPCRLLQNTEWRSLGSTVGPVDSLLHVYLLIPNSLSPLVTIHLFSL